MNAERALALAHVGRLDAAAVACTGDHGDRAAHVRAYVAAARGRYDDALVHARIAQRSADPVARHRASLTMASVLRLRHAHLDARPHDLAALKHAPDAAGRAHALVGLAADAVGIGDAAACAGMLAEAGASAPAGDWRVATRLGWVVAEHAMLRDRPSHAAEAAAASVALARRAGAVRHEAKSLLFLGAAFAQGRDDRAASTLAAAETMAVGIGAAPIAAVARALLAQG